MNRRSHQREERWEGNSSVMLGCIAEEGNRPEKDQENSFTGKEMLYLTEKMYYY